MIWDVVVVGAGAAGIFAALRAKALSPELTVLVLERGPKPLRKVKISGGGRCNVTHNCHDLDQLLQAYPRGGHRLEAYLSRFMPADTIDWFHERGVNTKVEADGRMFPTTDQSQTIIDCLLKEAHKLGVELRTRCSVSSLKGRAGQFELQTKSEKIGCKKVLLATGGGSKATAWLSEFGHSPVRDIPSLFTFCCDDPLLGELQGLSVTPVHAKIETEPAYESEGPFLITHWGLSGPAILKLSAFAARELFETDYKAQLIVNLLPEVELAFPQSSKQVRTASPFPTLPKRLWQRLVERAGVPGKRSWDRLNSRESDALRDTLTSLKLQISGKGVFKEEFVTSGGIPLHEIDIYTMESRKVPGLFIAGELLNVDGITGGYNFQNAWASGFVAGEGLS